jgi:hypothetical protein
MLAQASEGPENARQIHPEFGAEDWLRLIDTELDAQSELPTTSLNRPLRFINEPSTAGAYEFVMIQALGPNVGLYALSLEAPANSAFLLAESRVFELYRTLQTFQQDDGVLNAIEKALDVLGSLDREKEMHWSGQRTALPLDKVVYNTGEGKSISDSQSSKLMQVTL